jgi:hypothetical protein
MRREWGHLFYTRIKAPLLHTEPGCSDPPPLSGRPPVGVPASPWVWANARSKLGALIRLCGDGPVSNEAKMWSLFCTEINPFCTLNRAVPTHHRTPDAPRWRSRLALGVGEGQKQTRCIDSPVRRRGGVKWGENVVIYFARKKAPLLHTEPGCSDPPPTTLGHLKVVIIPPF